MWLHKKITVNRRGRALIVNSRQAGIQCAYICLNSYIYEGNESEQRWPNIQINVRWSLIHFSCELSHRRKTNKKSLWSHNLYANNLKTTFIRDALLNLCTRRSILNEIELNENKLTKIVQGFLRQLFTYFKATFRYGICRKL